MIFRPSIIAFTISTLVASTQVACSNSGFTGTSKTGKSNSMNCPNPPCDEPAVVRDRAVFAVRDLGCAMCHAKVESNIITDFMVGSDSLTEHQTLESWTYLLHLEKRDNFAHNPAPQISGTIVVPKTKVMRDNAPAAAGSAGRCSTFMKNSGASSTMSAAATPVDLKSTLDRCVSPYVQWGANSGKIEERDKVVIETPTSASEILAIAQKTNTAPVTGGITLLSSYDPVTRRANERAVATQTGFDVVDGGAGGVKVKGEATCEGALLIDAPVFLEDVTLKTSKGCRIYATASIFIKGRLDIVNPASPSDNAADVSSLMLMSPDFIGFHIALDNINARLGHDVTAPKTFKKGNPAAIKATIGQHAAALKYPKFTDAEADGAGAAISYERIVAAAPVVYSRMTGSFSGAVIAEHFMGKIGALSFKFDPVLERALFFPELIQDARAGRNLVETSNNALP